MPIRCFWELSRNINRISAQEDMRTLTLLNLSYSAENSKNYRDRLELELGDVMTYRHDAKSAMSEKLDRAGLAKLKTMNNIRR